jgi:hypothetical protein
MADKTSGYVNLNYVVNSVLMDMDEYTTSKRKKILQYAIFGVTELNIFVLPSVEVAYLRQNDDFTIDLPDDYLDYIKVGVEVGGPDERRIVTLTLNNTLPLPNTDKLKICPNSCVDEPTLTLNNTDYFIPGFGYYFAEHYRNGQYVGEMYGLGGGMGLMQYRVDLKNRQIILNELFENGEIVLEYKSTGIKTDGSTTIPRQAVAALRAYIKWELAENNDKLALSAKDRKRKLYLVEYRLLQYFTNTFTIDEYLDAKYQVSTATLKR